MEDTQLLIALNMIPMLGSKRIMDIYEKFKNLDDFLRASGDELKEIPGISDRISESIIKYREKINPNREIEKANKLGAQIITINDEDYPKLLKQIYDPPPVLYVLGDIDTFKYNAIAIVGTRKATSYGKKVAEDFGRELASMEINVVSGMARGIDSYAHKGATDAGGPTTAVLGCGIDIVYPPENISLMKKILRYGCVVTSFPMGMRPFSGNFPARNRIISGLSLGTLVVEAAEKSGSLITADFSLEQGREVFAIPGSIYCPYARGTHKLIKQGAKLAENVEDIINELCLTDEPLLGKKIPNRPSAKLSDDERALLDLIDFQPVHLEQLVHEVKKPPSEVKSIVVRLELKGLITTLPGGYVMKI